jgi:hypothetical protein
MERRLHRLKRCNAFLKYFIALLGNKGCFFNLSLNFLPVKRDTY